ncbi:hypothetical protein ONZ45_g4325 [Pleurotus djamor]|nr:hypothetical protein ONZ45_g4325 [Pleurotus djamor]
MDELSKFVARGFKEGQFEAWASSETLGRTSIDASTRYLTSTKIDSTSQHEHFPLSIDPHQVLESARGADYIRTADNVVHYYFRDLTGDRGQGLVSAHAFFVIPFSVDEIKPVEFRCGDIVEAIFSFNVALFKATKKISLVCEPQKSDLVEESGIVGA